jgi:hypothetical protein
MSPLTNGNSVLLMNTRNNKKEFDENEIKIKEEMISLKKSLKYS